MSAQLVSPFPLPTFATDEDFTVDGSGLPSGSAGFVCVYATAPDVTITMAEEPSVGQTVFVGADGVSGVVVDGGTHPIYGGPLLLAPNEEVMLQFAPSGQWFELSGAGGASPGSSFLTQPTWYFDAAAGDDANDGKTPATALKTWAEWQRRVGVYSTLAPTGGLLQLFVLTDLPQSDPVTFRNFLAPGSTAMVVGEEVVVASGTFATVTDKDPSTNTPASVSGAGLAAGQVGLAVKVASGAATASRTYLQREISPGVLHVGTWMVGPTNPERCDPDGFMVPGPAPSPGDGFDVVDYIKIFLGTAVVGAAGDQQGSLIPPTGLTLTKVRFPASGAAGPVNLLAWPTAAQGSTLTGMGDCIVEPDVEILNGGDGTNSGNNCFYGHVEQIAGQVSQQGGSHLTDLGAGNYGAWKVERGATLVVEEAEYVGQLADVQVVGACSAGQLAFWDTTHAIYPAGPGGGTIVFENSSPFFGTAGYVPLWGTGNHNVVVVFPNGSISFNEQQNNAGLDYILPTIVMNADALYPANTAAAFVGGDNVQPDAGKAHAWDTATAAYSAQIPVTWANFAVAFPAGFSTFDGADPGGGGNTFFANATNPATGGRIILDAFNAST